MNRFKASTSKTEILFPLLILVQNNRKRSIKLSWMYWLSFLLVFVSLLTACNKIKSLTLKTDSKLNDTSFLTEQPCKPPCWHDLKLNVSTLEQVEDKLAELPFIDQGTIKIRKNANLFGFSDATMIYYNCMESKGKRCGYLLLSDGYLKVTAHRIQYHLPLQSVIDKLGEPSYVIYSPYTSHGDGCMMDLDWPEMNIFTRSITETNSRLCQQIQSGEALDPNLGVNEVHYLVKEAFIPNHCKEYNCVPWPGFDRK